MGNVVTADMIVVRNKEGQQVYLNKGIELPDYVAKDVVKELKAAGLVEQTNTRTKAANPAPVSPPADPASSTGPFDPSKFNQDEVLAYLAEADAAEVDRVKAAEAEGQKRQKIAAFNAGDNE